MAYIASKGLGAIRQVLFNSLFGAGPQATAYYAAFRLPDTIFNLIAGGALAHAFIPVFLSSEKKYGQAEVWRLSSLVFNVLLVSLTAVVLIAELIAPAFVNNILVPGLPAPERALTTTLTRIMLLHPLILGLGTIATAILHSKRQFFPSALSIILYDVGLIGGILIARFIPGVGIYGPAYGLIASAVLQVAVQIPNVIKLGARYTFTWNLRDAGLGEILHLLGPNVLNVIVASSAAIVITYFASYLPDRASIAAMHNAFLLFTLPLTLVAQTIGNALLPQITMQATHGRYVRMSLTVLKIVSAAALLNLVAAIGLFIFGKPAIHYLFQYGAFNAHASALTSSALLGYAVGLPGQTVTALLVLAFYAIKDARTPLLINIIALAAQIGFTLLLLRVLKGSHAILAIPLAASLSATAQAILLSFILYVRLRAKVKMDKGMQRLQQRRMHIQALQELGRMQEPLKADRPHQLLVPHQLFQPVIPSQPMVESLPVEPVVESLPVEPVVEDQRLAAHQVTRPMAPYQAEEESLPLQSVADYQRSVLLDPGNLTALVGWHIAMMTTPDSETATILELLTRICRQLRSGEQSDYEMLIREYNQAARAHPENAHIHFALGQIYQRTGNYDKAIEAYKLAMHSSVVEVMTRFSIAQCQLFKDEPERAVQQLEEALQSVRHSATGSIDPGVWAARPRQEGEEHLAPEVEISILLAKAYRLTGRQEDTQTLLRQVKQIFSFQDEVSSTPAELTAFRRDGDSTRQDNANLLHDNHNKSEAGDALNVLKGMVHAAEKEPQSRGRLADMYIKSGLLNDAIAELRNLAIEYLRNLQVQEAVETMRRISKIHAEAGDLLEALTYLHHAVELLPGDPELLHEMVDLCLQVGRAKEAARYQAKIALHYLDTDQVKESIAALEQLIAIDGSNHKAYDLLGKAYQSMGEYDQATRAYESLAREDPESTVARERLAELLELQQGSKTHSRSIKSS